MGLVAGLVGVEVEDEVEEEVVVVGVVAGGGGGAVEGGEVTGGAGGLETGGLLLPLPPEQRPEASAFGKRVEPTTLWQEPSQMF